MGLAYLPRQRTAGAGAGRVSLAISYGPVDNRTAAVHKAALLKALGAVRTTHHPSAMLTHDRQGYPRDWTAEAEHEPQHERHGHGGPLRDLRVPLNPDVSEAEFQDMLRRAGAHCVQRHTALCNVQQRLYDSYWGRAGLDEADCFAPMSRLLVTDIRRLLHSRYSQVQGLHSSELDG